MTLKSLSPLFRQHFRLLEERKRSEKDSHLSDTLPRKKVTPTMTSQFTCATLGRSFPNKVQRRESVQCPNLLALCQVKTVQARFFYQYSGMRAKRFGLLLDVYSPISLLCRARAAAASFQESSPYPTRKQNLAVCTKVKLRPLLSGATRIFSVTY